MKGLIAFNKFNDVSFIGCDEEFTAYINKHAVSVGLINITNSSSRATGSSEVVDENVIVQLFSPLVSSQRVLIEDMLNPYSCITCHSGMLFVLQQFGEQIHMAINGDGEESEEYLNKKLHLFQRLVGFHYGPVIDGIRSEMGQMRRHTWKTLYKLVLTWQHLYDTEQAFLMEATERLNVNHVVNGICLELLQSVRERMMGAGEKNMEHSLLLVNSKLLSLFSRHNAPELQPSDLLTIILLVQNHLPANEITEDTCIKTQAPSGNKGPSNCERDIEKTISSTEISKNETMKELGDQYETTPKLSGQSETTKKLSGQSETTKKLSETTKKLSGQSETTKKLSGQSETTKKLSDSSGSTSDGAFKDTVSMPTSELLHNVAAVMEEGKTESEVDVGGKKSGADEDDSEVEYYSPRASPVPSVPHRVEQIKSEDSTSPQKDTPARSTSSGESSMASSHSLASGSWRQQQKKEHYLRFTVFLSTPFCQYTPHLLYCVQIFPGIVLVVITQMTHASVSGHLCKILSIIREIKSSGSSQLLQQHGGSVFDVLDVKIDKLSNMFKRTNLSTAVEKLLLEIRKRWSDTKGHQLLAYLEGGAKGLPGPRLESLLSQLFTKVCGLFRLLYLSHHQTPRPIYKTITASKLAIRKDLQDFHDYLLVKARRNIAMTNYIADFPGLVHFIYVDRMSNLITAPSLDPTSPALTHHNITDATTWLKLKIWEQADWMLSRVSHGLTTISAKHGDFQFSFFLWFEDNSGRSVEPDKPFTLDNSLPPNVSSRHLYTHLVQRCFPSSVPGEIHCYELLTVHVAVVPPQYILQQSRRLSTALWETSAEAFIPISLL